MAADECELYQQGYCLGKVELGEAFHCDKMIIDDDEILIECGGNNDELITACAACQVRPADAEFPNEELCTKCAGDLNEQ